jgi:SAM-dependent methyltransferase
MGGFHMAERTTGPWALLEWPALYTAFQKIVAGKDARAEVTRLYIRSRPNDRVMDIGCGPADILPYLGDVDYIGIDHNPQYIRQAQARWGNRGRFVCGDASEAATREPGTFDLVLAIGVLHHLNDDQVRGLLDTVKTLLKPGGRLVTIDPAFTEPQNPIARFLIRNDRGQNVRAALDLEQLVAKTFPATTLHLRTDLMRLPYTHAILEATKG